MTMPTSISSGWVAVADMMRGWRNGCVGLWMMLGAVAAQAGDVKVSEAVRLEQVDLVDVGALIPKATLEIRYAGDDNFVGRPVDGYRVPKCYLLRPAAEALRQVADDLAADGYRLRLFDCYRPVRAVRDFVRWARDPADQRTKPRFYPNLDKSTLLDGYIAETSGHSRGATVDLGLERCDGARCELLDMGTGFDRFDTLANTDDPRIVGEQKTNRQRLRAAMEHRGFRNYPLEWWHYTFQPEPTPTTAYDIPVQ